MDKIAITAAPKKKGLKPSEKQIESLEAGTSALLACMVTIGFITQFTVLWDLIRNEHIFTLHRD